MSYCVTEHSATHQHTQQVVKIQHKTFDMYEKLTTAAATALTAGQKTHHTHLEWLVNSSKEHC